MRRRRRPPPPYRSWGSPGGLISLTERNPQDLRRAQKTLAGNARAVRLVRGWMGRADQSAKVRGLFVHPSHIAELVRRLPVFRRARVVITRPGNLDVMTLRAEVSPEDRPRLAEALRATLRDRTQLRGEVELVDLRTLPNDGKVIEDQRPVG